jgi:phage protein D
VPDYFVPAFQILVDGEHLAADVSKNIQQVSVISAPDTLDKFSLSLVNPLPKMRWTHTDDAKLFKPGAWVKIKMGYGSDLQDMMEGEITHFSPSFPDGGTPTVTIEGHSLMHRLRGENKTQTFQQVTGKQIAEKIGQDAGLQVQAEDPGVQHDYVIQPNQSDLQFLKDVAKKVCFEVLVQGKTLIFRKIKEAEPKTLTFVWYGVQESFAPPPDTLPLKSFSPQMNVIEPPNTVEYRGWDWANKQAFVSQATTAQQTTTMGGTKKAADVSSNAYNRQRKIVRVNHPFASKEEGDKGAASEFNAKALGFVSGSAETIGVPNLSPGQVVEFKGLGPIFDGSYLVGEVTHSITEGGFQTNFSVQRNAQ